MKINQKFGHAANQCDTVEKNKMERKQAVVNTRIDDFVRIYGYPNIRVSG